jgi:hypothetical protein
MHKLGVFAAVLVLLTGSGSASGKQLRATVVYDDVASEITNANEDAGQLWITTADLQRTAHFELKRQGVCRGVLCFPLPKGRHREFLRDQQGEAWFNLTAFAHLVDQPVAHDEALATWYFGLRSDQRQRLSSLEAPDFALPDITGKMHSLSDFRGKKVFLVTWASW